MDRDESEALAIDLTVAAARMTRWLRAVDPDPTFGVAEASVMAVLIHSDGVSPSLLARIEQVRPPTITKLVDGLVRRGLAERTADPADGRASIVRATDAGRRTWQAAQRRRVAPLADRIGALTPQERAALDGALPLLERLSAPEESG